jgi:hypothetical protein
MKLLIGIIFLFLTSCSEKVTEQSLIHLNGYWEIKQVSFPHGQDKDYLINPIVDYIHYEGMQGYRKKVKPRIDGTFTVTDDSETFKVRKANEIFWIHYENDLSSWEEQIIELSKNELTLSNKEGLIYFYKRYNPNKPH